MRKRSRLLVLALLVCAIVAVNYCVANAAVKTSLKKGVFTVSGKGKMKSSQIPRSKNKKKIKKVIIKKGVTSIPDRAFKDCNKLKTVKIASTVKSLGKGAFYGTAIKSLVIPKNVKVIQEDLFEDCKQLSKVTLRGDFTLKDKRKCGGESSYISAKTFVFSTPFVLKNMTYLRTNNIQVSAKDPKFSSINGVLYSKDKKTLVRVPSKRKTLRVESGCVTIATSALSYVEVGPDDTGAFVPILDTLIIPSSVKKISTDLFQDPFRMTDIDGTGILNVIGGDNLDGESFSNLLVTINMEGVREFVDTAKTKGYLTEDGKMTIYKGDHLLMLASDEEEDEIVIPDKIKSIGACVIGMWLEYSGAKNMQIHIGTVSGGKNAKSISEYAFSDFRRGWDNYFTIDHIALEKK